MRPLQGPQNNRTRTTVLSVLFVVFLLFGASHAQQTDPKVPKIGPTQNVGQSIEALLGPDGKTEDTSEQSSKKVLDPSKDEPILYISDTDNGRIIVMQGIKGDGFISFGLPGYGFGRFLRPAQIWVDSERRVYVADSGNNRIVRIDQRSSEGWSEFTNLSSPKGVAVDNSGVYISDTKANKVIKVEEIVKDTPVLETLTHPQMTKPTGLWIDAQGALYICAGEDPPGGKVFKTWMEDERRRWAIFDGHGLAGSRFRPSSLVTTNGDLKFLDDSGTRVINMENTEGRKMKVQRFRKSRQYRLRRPRGIALDKSGKRFFIADSGNDRILEVTGNGTVVGEFSQLDNDPASVLRNPTSIFVFSPAPSEEPKEDKEEDDS